MHCCVSASVNISMTSESDLAVGLQFVHSITRHIFLLSCSANLDNVAELLVHTGKEPSEALMLLV